MITLFVFCCGAACADLGRGDTGRQAALSGQQATLGFSLSPLPARRTTERPFSVYFFSVGDMNRPDVAPLMPLARQKAAAWSASHRGGHESKEARFAAASCAAITLIARLLAVVNDFTQKETGKYESS